MNKIVTLHDKDFEVYISQDQINSRIDELAEQIDKDYKGKMITMIGNLTGAFIIMADLCRHLKTPVDIKFVKYSSYSGMESTHVVKERMGFVVPTFKVRVLVGQQSFSSERLFLCH